jgi:outer membrane protein assembly factor BamB
MIAATGNICTDETAQDDNKPTPESTYNVLGRQVQNPNVALMKDGKYPVGQITAVDVATGNTVWQYQQRAYNYSAVLATAGGLVFNGDAARYFFALDTTTGEKDLASPSRIDVLRLSGQLLGGRAPVYRGGGRLWAEQPGARDR